MSAVKHEGVPPGKFIPLVQANRGEDVGVLGTMDRPSNEIRNNFRQLFLFGLPSFIVATS
jgi:hypothetical protein